MFVLVDFIKNDVTFKGRIYELFSSPNIIYERVETGNSLPFFIMKVQKHKGKIPFDAMCDILGTLKNSVILKENIALPENSGIHLFSGEKLKKRLIFNSAVHNIALRKLSPTEISVTVIDFTGEYINDIEKLVFLCGEISIVTHEKLMYNRLRHFLLEKYGVSVLITDSVNKLLKDTDFIISCSSVNIPIYFNGTIYTDRKKAVMGGQVIAGEGIELPPKYEKLCPEGFDKMKFACALYEKCGIEELAKLKYKDLLT